jgi:hypothetical protein
VGQALNRYPATVGRQSGWRAQAARSACKECTKAPLAHGLELSVTKLADVIPSRRKRLPQCVRIRHDHCVDEPVIRIVESLLEVQNIKLQQEVLTPAQEAQSQALRAKVPAGVLEKFNRLVGRGKRPVAIVRSSVCGECHLRLSSGTLASLAYTTEIHYCDNCGRFLYLPEDEPLGLTSAASSPPGRKHTKRAAAHVL